MTRVIVEVEGGTIIGVRSDEPVQVLIMDYDVDGFDNLFTNADGQEYLGGNCLHDADVSKDGIDAEWKKLSEHLEIEEQQ